MAGSVQLDLKSLVLADQFILDYAFGIGYGFTTKDTEPYNYGFFVVQSDLGAPYTYSVTLKMGYLMN